MLHRQLNAGGLPSHVFQLHGDYYEPPNLLPLLCQGSRLEHLMQTMDYPLPERKPA